MNKQPKLLDVFRMRDIFSPHYQRIGENIYFSNEIAVLHGHPTIFKLIMQQTPPFVINDHRLGVILRGEIEANFNLVDRHLTAGMLVYFGPGSVLSPIRFSDDLEMMGVGLFADFPMPFATGQFPPAFNGQVRNFQLQVAENDVQTACHILDTLWHLVHQPDYHRPTVSTLVAALMHHYDHLFRQQADHLATIRSREQTIFDRFISLVNQHSREQHQLDYYADRMCLTKRYLGTVIRQTSGITAKEWIDRALINYAKAQLLHSDLSVAQISEDLNFPNPSFFSKYFKRITHMTPLAFVKAHG